MSSLSYPKDTRPVFSDPGQDIHLWWGSLDLPCKEQRLRWEMLTPDEHRQASTYDYPSDRRRYVAIRSTLRLLLAHYLGVSPATLLFRADLAGKPALAGILSETCALEFNASHSGDWLAVALTQRGPIGIDIERVRTDLDMTPIASRFFPEREWEQWRSLPLQERITSFFERWTCHEAYSKARGERFAVPASRPTATLDEVQCSVPSPEDEEETPLWTLRPLTLIPGRMRLAGAVAVAGDKPVRLIVRRWHKSIGQ